MRQLRDNGRRFYDFLRGLVIGPQDYVSSIGPQFGVVVPSISNAANANVDLDWSTATELLDGYYQVSAAIIVEMLDATYREVRFAFSLVWTEATGLVLQGTPTAITGAWNSTGLTVSVTVAGDDDELLRFNVANASGQALVGGALYVSFGRRSVSA